MIWKNKIGDARGNDKNNSFKREYNNVLLQGDYNP